MTADLDPYDVLDRWGFDYDDDYESAWPTATESVSLLDRYDNYRYDHK